MSKHNYTQYSNKQNNSVANGNNHPNKANRPINNPVEKVEEAKPVFDQILTQKVIEPKVETKPVVKSVVETVETVAMPDMVEGVIVNCAKLNVREKPTVNSDIVCVLDAKSEVQVEVARTTSMWAYIRTAAGAEGYCMREYVDAHM